MTRRQAPPIWNSFTLDLASSSSRQEQIAAYVRNAVLSGALKPGDRLPSTRLLAAELGTARQTVVLAFDRLAADGFIEGRRGSGAFVASSLSALANASGSAKASFSATAAHGPASRLSKRGRRMEGQPALPTLTDPGLLAPGLPVVETFPVSVWARLSDRFWRQTSRAHLAYADAGGFLPLRAAIADHLGATRGLVCTADDIVVTAGSQQGIKLAAEMLLDPGDQAWVEDPSYRAGRGALLAAGANIIPEPIDEKGFDAAAGERLAPKARLALVTPSHQFPRGVTMSLTRRLALLEWADRAGAWIIEDDYDSDFRFEGKPSRPLRALGFGRADCRIVYIGTFSRVLAPGLRIGFLVAPAGTAKAFIAARALMDLQPASPNQAVLADFIAEGHLAVHLRRMRALFAERREALLNTLQDHCHGLLDWEEKLPEMGLHLTAQLSTRQIAAGGDAMICQAAGARGLRILPLSDYCFARNDLQGLVLGYAATTAAQMDGAARLLQDTIIPMESG